MSLHEEYPNAYPYVREQIGTVSYKNGDSEALYEGDSISPAPPGRGKDLILYMNGTSKEYKNSYIRSYKDKLRYAREERG